ncbi:MAG: PAS domain S-box protein [Deltaproteobacteria bacterium]|nr:PAS domain S-box protein [Deltaproteobacteria bacterium]
MIKIAIIGAGKGGSALLDIFHTNGEVKVVGISDKDKNAQGLVLAEQWGIFIAGGIKEICDQNPDIVINATGQPETSRLIKESFPYPVEIIEGTVARLMWELVTRQQKARKDIEAIAMEKIKVLQELEDSHNYLQGVLDDSQDMIVTTDTEGKVIKFSKGGERILGYRMDEIIGRSALELYADEKEREKILDTVKKKGAAYNYETVLLTKDGAPRDISLTISELRDKWGSVIGTVGVSKDITEEKHLRKEMENLNIELEELNERLEEKVLERTRELERTNRELKKANELKGRFIANASHELRTPLNSIIGFSDVLLGKTFGDLTEKQERYINTILTSGKHLLHLVNNILDLAKIEAGKTDLSYETFKVKDVINEVIMVLKPLIDRKMIGLETEVGSDVDIFTADKVKFKQVLYNLLSNAVKFTPDGGKVQIGIEKLVNNALLPWAFKGQEFLGISVRDTGPGIRPKDMDRIFDEFEQLDPSKSTEGTGLGLSLTKKLVELHGGHISLESEYGQGASFNVYLPFVIDIEVLKEPQAAPPLDLPWMKDEGPVVLVVEDDLPTAELITIHLSQAGYRVSHAYDGVEAIQKAKDEKPFAITLDVMLPKKDGWEVLQSLKTDPVTRDIPVIIQSIIENKELAFAL